MARGVQRQVRADEEEEEEEDGEEEDIRPAAPLLGTKGSGRRRQRPRQATRERRGSDPWAEGTETGPEESQRALRRQQRRQQREVYIDGDGEEGEGNEEDDTASALLHRTGATAGRGSRGKRSKKGRVGRRSSSMGATSSAYEDLLYTMRSDFVLVMVATLVAGLAAVCAVILGTHEGPLFGSRPRVKDPHGVPRLIPTAAQQGEMRDRYIYSKTTLYLGGEEGHGGGHRERALSGGWGGRTSTAVSLQAMQVAGKEGHERLPDLFYDGVVLYGLSAWDPSDRRLSAEENVQRTKELEAAIAELQPPPQHVYRANWEADPVVAATAAAKHKNEAEGEASARGDGDDWYLEGFVLAFSLEALQKLSPHAHDSDGDGSSRGSGSHTRAKQPPVWAPAEEAVLRLGRRFEQFILYKWHSAQWGPGTERDQRHHTSVLQDILVCRTGYNAVKSSAVVYRAPRTSSRPRGRGQVGQGGGGGAAAAGGVGRKFGHGQKRPGGGGGP